MKDIFQKLEEDLLYQEIRSSREELDLLLDEDFLEYGSSGKIYTKDIILEKLPDSKFSLITIQDFSILKISEGFIQTRFKTIEKNRTSLRSSIWKKYWENDWKMTFHQWTPIED